MHKERAFRAGLLVPGQKLRLVRMGGEPVDGVDPSPNRDLLTENVHFLGAVDDTAAKRSIGSRADKHDARGVVKIVPKVMTDATTQAHAGSRP